MSYKISIYANGFSKSKMTSDSELFTRNAFQKYRPGDHYCAEYIKSEMEKSYGKHWNVFIFPDSNGSSSWYGDQWIRFIVTGESLGREKYHVCIFK